MSHPGSPWRARVEVPNSPEAVAAMLHGLAQCRIAVVSLFAHAQVDDAMQLVDMFLVAPADVTQETITELLSETSSQVVVAHGIPEDAEDIATRVLYLASRLVDDPASAPQAAAELVLARSWEVTPATEGDAISAHVMRLQWTPDRHVILRRYTAAFTRTERDRASALLALVASAAVVRGVEDDFGWSADGDGVVTRLARPGDTDAVARLHDRCSESTLFQRYFAPVSEWRSEQLRRITGGHRGATLVLVHDNEVIGLGNVFPDESEASAVAEIALMIDDAHQGAGRGRLLLERLVSLARRMGFTHVLAYVLADNPRMQHVLETSGLEWDHGVDPQLGEKVVRFVARL